MRLQSKIVQQPKRNNLENMRKDRVPCNKHQKHNNIVSITKIIANAPFQITD